MGNTPYFNGVHIWSLELQIVTFFLSWFLRVLSYILVRDIKKAYIIYFHICATMFKCLK